MSASTFRVLAVELAVARAFAAAFPPEFSSCGTVVVGAPNSWSSVMAASVADRARPVTVNLAKVADREKKLRSTRFLSAGKLTRRDDPSLNDSIPEAILRKLSVLRETTIRLTIVSFDHSRLIHDPTGFPIGRHSATPSEAEVVAVASEPSTTDSGRCPAWLDDALRCAPSTRGDPGPGGTVATSTETTTAKMVPPRTR